MAKDITLLGASYTDVPAVQLPQTGGGTARFDDCSVVTATASDVAQGKIFVASDGTITTGTASGGGGESWSWMGKNPTLVQSSLNEKVYLKDTPFASWTPTTTSTKMSDASNLTSYTPNLGDYDYVAVYKCHTHFEYGGGATNTAKLVDYFYTSTGFIAGYPNTYERMEEDSVSAAANASITERTGMVYYNNSLPYYTFGSYGYFVYTFPAPTASTSSITLKKPQINARCSTSYFSTANASEVDMNTSYCEMKIELWRVDRGTSAYGNEVARVHDMYEGNF